SVLDEVGTGSAVVAPVRRRPVLATSRGPAVTHHDAASGAETTAAATGEATAAAAATTTNAAHVTSDGRDARPIFAAEAGVSAVRIGSGHGVVVIVVDAVVVLVGRAIVKQAKLIVGTVRATAARLAARAGDEFVR